MTKTICVIDGHPDPDPSRFIHAITDAYCDGATRAGFGVERIDVATLQPEPLLRNDAFDQPPQEPVLGEREKLVRANHVMLAFPLWLGSMPAATRAFFEQAASGRFLIQEPEGDSRWPKKLMKGKSARIIVTMGMPAFIYRTIMGSSALKALEKGIFGISGFKPIRHTIFGGVNAVSDAKRQDWLEEVRQLGEAGR